MELLWILGKLAFFVVLACAMFWLPIIFGMTLWEEARNIWRGTPNTELGLEIARSKALFELWQIRRSGRREARDVAEQAVSRMVGKKAEAEAQRVLRRQRMSGGSSVLRTDNELDAAIDQAVDELRDVVAGREIIEVSLVDEPYKEAW